MEMVSLISCSRQVYPNLGVGSLRLERSSVKSDDGGVAGLTFMNLQNDKKKGHSTKCITLPLNCRFVSNVLNLHCSDMCIENVNIDYRTFEWPVIYL